MQLDRIIDLFDAEIVSFQPAEPKIVLKFSEPGLPHRQLSNCGTTEGSGTSPNCLRKPSGGVRKTGLDRLRRVG